MKKRGVFKYFLVSLGVIVLDQIVKLIVHFNMVKGLEGQIKVLGNWFKLHYLTNKGMAFGLELPFEHGKVLLTLFRVFAMVAIAFYLIHLYRKQAPNGLLMCVGLILGGAIGNLIDSIFYGVLLKNAPFDAPYPWFHGQVVDMFYIDIWEGYIGDRYMALWPVFNVADASIFIAITVILIFQKRFFKKPDELVPETESKSSKDSNIDV